MKFPRREFLKKTGLVTAAGFIPHYLPAWQEMKEMEGINAEGSYLIRNGEIISMDEQTGDLAKGSILVVDGKITEIAETLAAPEGVEIVDATGAVIMPGLIDCHWHLWTSLMRSMSGTKEDEGYFPMTRRYSRYFTPADMETATMYAAAEAISSGITTLTDYNHNARSPEFVLAGCKALAHSGIRARVEYNGYRNKPSEEPTDFEGIKKVLSEIQQRESWNLLSLGLGSRGAGYEHLEKDWEQARELGLRIAIHASSNKEQIGQIRKLQERGLLGSDVNIIHGNAIQPDEIDAVAKAGASITMTPFTEMRIGYGLPVPNKLRDAGINTSIGVDSTALSGNADLFAVMKLLQNLSNAKAEDEFHIQPQDLLKMATINGARTLGIDHFTGSLAPGKRADLIMLKKNDLNFSSGTRTKNLLVEATQPQNVDMVMVDGKILKQNGRLTTIDSEDIILKAEAAFRRLYKEVNN